MAQAITKPSQNGIDKRQGSWSRYHAIILSIGLFLVFDLGVLILNFYISAEIKDDAVAVNLAGRQRMLSQRTVKSLLQYQIEQANGNATAADKARNELRTTVTLFDNTFNAFITGGMVKGADGSDTLIAPVSTDSGRQTLSDAQAIWTPYLERLLPIRGTDTPTESQMLSLISYAEANNLALLKLMNDLTNNLEGVAAAKAGRLRMIQTIGIGLALLNFGLILFHFLRKLHESDRINQEFSEQLQQSNQSLASTTNELRRAQQQTNEILDTVGEGLFLIDADGMIAEQHSRELNRILPGRTPGGSQLLELLRPIVDDKVYSMTKDFLTLLFRPSVKEKMLLNVNPLDEVEAHIDQGNGRVQTRHLSFSFNRVTEDGTIRDALVTVRDITQQVLLARELEASETRAQAQMELVFNMIHLPPGQLQLFLNETERRLQKINDLLRDVGASDDLRALANAIFREVHSIKGESAALGFELFQQASHTLEDKLAELRDQPKLSGEDFVASTLGLDTLINQLHNTRDLVKRFSSLGGDLKEAQPVAMEQSGESYLTEGLARLASQLSKDLGKPLTLDTSGFDPTLIPAPLSQGVKDILIQLIRNSATHGIETTSERLAKGKLAAGTIKLHSERDASGLKISVSDDGRGLDLAAIRERAVAKGLLAVEDKEQATNQSLASMIFQPGFSTRDQADAHAGRGVGMDIVRDFIAGVGGRIRMSFSRDRYFELSLTLPEHA